MFMVMDSHLKETVKQEVPKSSNTQILCKSLVELYDGADRTTPLCTLFRREEKKYTNISTYN